MAQHKELNFILIDDSYLDCFIIEKIIKNTGKAASIKIFMTAQEALEYILSTTKESDSNFHTILFVDIQMPIMNGFDFVEAFEKLPMNITSQYSLYMISSSLNDYDLNRVNRHPSIKHFLNKPLTSNNIALLLAQE